jgi:hypothetical protein
MVAMRDDYGITFEVLNELVPTTFRFASIGETGLDRLANQLRSLRTDIENAIEQQPRNTSSSGTRLDAIEARMTRVSSQLAMHIHLLESQLAKDTAKAAERAQRPDGLVTLESLKKEVFQFTLDVWLVSNVETYLKLQRDNASDLLKLQLSRALGLLASAQAIGMRSIGGDVTGDAAADALWMAAEEGVERLCKEGLASMIGPLGFLVRVILSWRAQEVSLEEAIERTKALVAIKGFLVAWHGGDGTPGIGDAITRASNREEMPTIGDAELTVLEQRSLQLEELCAYTIRQYGASA